MKLKYIAAAVGLMASAASQATIVEPDNTGLGELTLVVYDTNASYTLDLGVSFNQFLANANTSSTLATLGSANWSTFVSAEGANSADWKYAVIGGETNNGAPNASILATINADDFGNVIGQFDSSNVQGSIAQVQTYDRNVNRTGTHGSVANGDSFNIAGTPAFFLQSQMDTFNLGFYHPASALDTAMAVQRDQRQTASFADPIETVLPGQMNLTSNGYVLTYTVAAVPEASGYAMAMAGFGALGFVGLRRRDRS